jgi:hypothetical protein
MLAMLPDLNLVWTPQPAEYDLVRALHFSKSRDYDIVALHPIIPTNTQHIQASPSIQCTEPIIMVLYVRLFAWQSAMYKPRVVMSLYSRTTRLTELIHHLRYAHV